jgi:hypothetical protein
LKSLGNYPFAFAEIIARHFDLSPPMMKDVLIGELGLQKFIRRWVPHLLSEAQKKFCVTECAPLLDLLEQHHGWNFNPVATKEELWFRSMYPAHPMCAQSTSQVTPFVRSGVEAFEVMITIFFTGTRLLVLDVLP